jgi:hypothetical protein
VYGSRKMLIDVNCNRSADDLALNTSHLEELEEVSRAARHARNQLAQTLRVESVKERDLMHKYSKDVVSRSGLLVRQSVYTFGVVVSDWFSQPAGYR